jgi:hypothetical protein
MINGGRTHALTGLFNKTIYGRSNDLPVRQNSSSRALVCLTVQSLDGTA